MLMRAAFPGTLCNWRRATLFCLMGMLVAGTLARGQDVAEAARQEKERKAKQQKSASHVYLPEDLKRSQILTPEDQAKVEARRKNPVPASAPTEQAGGVSPNRKSEETESLGEAARRYRREKAAREAAGTMKGKEGSPFRMELPAAGLAAPHVAPNAAVDPGNKMRGAEMRGAGAAGVVTPPRMNPKNNGLVERASPFAPRPLSVAPKSAAGPVNPGWPAMARGPVERLVVQRGDSWWKLAQRYLGSGARWEELRGLNPGYSNDPERLLLGSVVIVPVVGKVVEGSPSKMVTVREGDSLWSLARTHLGHGSAWECIAQANPEIKDYTHLAVGLKLQLVADGAGLSCTSRIAGQSRK